MDPNRIYAAMITLMGVPSCATAAGPARQPTLAGSLVTHSFYVGSWQCKGTSYSSTEGQPDAMWDAVVKVEPELGGTWLSVKMTGPGAQRTIEHKGYDPETKRWTHVAMINDGTWISASSPGWTGSDLVFIPDDRSDASRSTFTKLGEASYSHVVTLGAERVWGKICTKL